MSKWISMFSKRPDELEHVFLVTFSGKLLWGYYFEPIGWIATSLGEEECDKNGEVLVSWMPCPNPKNMIALKDRKPEQEGKYLCYRGQMLDDDGSEMDVPLYDILRYDVSKDVFIDGWDGKSGEEWVSNTVINWSPIPAMPKYIP